MKIMNKNIVVTGAGGGIGALVTKLLIKRGATLVLTDLKDDALIQLQGENSSKIFPFIADISQTKGCQDLVEYAQNKLGKIDIVLNIAGVMSFGSFLDEDLRRMDLLFRVNVLAPQLLARLVLPAMVKQGSGQIVNIGSMFGSIGFPYHVSYSSSKFALRGFSEALRRELYGTGVTVTYVSPRAVRTGFTDEAMAAATGMNMDSPQFVAERIVQAIERGEKDCYIGFPESLFARINGVLPRLIDLGLKNQSKSMRPFAVAEGRTY